MKLATINNGTADGRLAVVSRDLTRAVYVESIASTMMEAVENWARVEPSLDAVYVDLNAGKLTDSFAFDVNQALAPLPRCYQFVDGSGFSTHGETMMQAYNLKIELEPGIPILVQRQSDDFRSPTGDYAFPSEADNGDFEGEFAVIVDDVPMGVARDKVLDHVKLITILNDISMRGPLLRELKMGFGPIQAKPATVFAPLAVTPDELGSAWKDGVVHLDMHVTRNGEWFGNPNGREMDFPFDLLLSHLAYNRNLRAGTIVGSGTVSNRNWREVGSACLAERRALDVVEFGEERTEYLKFGERLRFEVFDEKGDSIFGAIDHKMVKAG